MKKLFLYMGCAVAMLSACDPNEDYIDTLNSDAKAAGIDMPEVLTLGEEDYSLVEISDMFASKDEAANLVPQILTSKYAANTSNEGNLINVSYQLDATAYFADLYTSDDEYVLADEEYTVEFGQKYSNFYSVSDLDKYAPVFLKEKEEYKYSKEGDEMILEFAMRGAIDKYQEYTFNGTVWSKTDKIDSDFDVDNAYELTSDDYDSMGTDKYDPGEKDRFGSFDNIEEYLIVLLSAKYPSAKSDDIVTVKFKYYDNNAKKVVYAFDGTDWSLKGYTYYDWVKGDWVLSGISVDADDKFIFKANTGWEVIVITTYTFTTADYALTGDEGFGNYGYYDNKPGTLNGVEVENVLQAKVNLVLTTNYPDAVEGALFEVTYNYYDNGTNAVSKRYQKVGDKFILVVEE